MKYLTLVVTLVFVLVVGGCESEAQLDYSDFDNVRQLSYSAAESKENERYILYYYSENCGHCNDVKQEVLSFFKTFEYLNVYLIDTGAQEVKDVSKYDEFVGTPSVFIIADGEVLESYIGSVEIRSFIELYRDFDLNMSVFSSQIIMDGNDLLDIDRTVLVYLYDDMCTDCDSVDELFLKHAYRRGPKDVYIVDVQNTHNVPKGLLSLGDGPILVKMSNGLIQETYQDNAVVDYMDELKNNVLQIEYDYESFIEHHLTDYDDLLTIDEPLYVAYYYSSSCPYCNAIKNEVLSLFDTFEYPFYLFDSSVTTGDRPAGLQGVPTLRVMIDGHLEIEYVGSLEISSFIQSYQDGTLHLDDYVD